MLVLLVLSSPVGAPSCSFAVDLWIDSLPKVGRLILNRKIKATSPKAPPDVIIVGQSYGALRLLYAICCRQRMHRIDYIYTGSVHFVQALRP